MSDQIDMSLLSSFEGYRRSELRRALKQVDPAIFEHVMRFLEEDPKTFGSGYSKEMMWRYIRRYDLVEADIVHLERAALKYLKRPMRPEYKRMCQTMAHLGSPKFWQEVATCLNSSDPVEQINAYCLYQYSKGIYAGERARLEMKDIKRKIRQRYDVRNKRHYGIDRYGKQFFYGQDVIDVLENVSVWPEGEIVYRLPHKDDLPITRRGPYDEQIAAFDYRKCNPNRLIASLAHILWEGSYHYIGTTLHAWVYVLYIYGELHNPKTLPVIRGFFEQRIQDQFENAGKWYVTQAVCRALERINTEEARKLAAAYTYPDTLLDRHMKTFVIGWLLNKQ